MNPIGGGLLLFIAYFGLRGFQRGLVDEVGRLVGLILAIVLANKLAANLAVYIGLDNEFARKAVAFVGIFIVVLLVVGFAARALQTLLELVLLGWLDKLGGILFGVLKSLVVLGVLVYVLEGFPATNDFLKRLHEQSFVFRNVAAVKNGLFKALSLDDMMQSVHEQVKNLEPEKILPGIIEDQE
ncbi:MAG: CvpA family protein [Candidatus Marinimicrobia bacterium]|nr:CvpA family protein [Candidatus Neomarinimicrobiota bacterium]